MLADFISANRDELIARCRAKVALRRAPGPVETELELGVPLFVDQLVGALRGPELASAEIARGATLNGGALRDAGVTVAQVVHCYGDVCQAVTELAVEADAPITADEFHTLNRCVDEAIAAAATEFQDSRDRAFEAEDGDRNNRRFGVFAHELRNLLGTATLSYNALLTGSVGIAGNTGAILGRSLRELNRLIDRTLAEVRLAAGLAVTERFSVAAFIEEIEIAAVLEAKSRGLRLTVAPGSGGLFLDADRQTLSSVITNLLQNAMKFSHAGGLVVLQVLATNDRVLIEVRDECGGLPAGRAEELFRPFAQRGADRTGLGLGLAICYEGVKANGGTIHVGNLPGTGCVFTVDLPRAQALSATGVATPETRGPLV